MRFRFHRSDGPPPFPRYGAAKSPSRRCTSRDHYSRTPLPRQHSSSGTTESLASVSSLPGDERHEAVRHLHGLNT